MDLHLKYRPTTLKEVIGQEAVTSSLRRMFGQENIPHTFLFHGPSGTGKTTLARIIANAVKAQVMEIDAATYTGIDSMRAIMDPLQYLALGDKKNKCVIIDECHALSKQAWQSLLKIVEEPPAHVYFVFCTTERDKVPKTIVTRAHTFALQPVTGRQIEELLVEVLVKEKLSLPEGAIEHIARQAQGSVRQALVYLSICDGIKDLAKIKSLIEAAGEEGQAVELYRLLCNGQADWTKALVLVRKMEEVSSWESVRIGLMNYCGAVLFNTKDPTRAQRLLAILDAFAKPLNRSSEKAEFLLALGTVLFI